MDTLPMMSQALCDEVYMELSEMRIRMIELKQKMERASRFEGDFAERYERHLEELAGQIDWKLQILSHACSHEWKGSNGFEDTVSVRGMEGSEADELAAYAGG